MKPTTPRKRRSPPSHYAPFIAIVVVIAIVAIALAVSNSGEGNKGDTAVVKPGGTAASEVPIQYQAAQKAGTLADYTWQTNCDTTTGRVAMPILAPAPCVPKFTGDNGGANPVPQGTPATTLVSHYT